MRGKENPPPAGGGRLRMEARKRWADGVARLQAGGIEAGEAERMLQWLAAAEWSCGLLEVRERWAAGVGDEFWPRWDDGVKRLERGEPVQYVIGETEFWGLRFFCDKRALIPRPETERLVEAAVEFLTERLHTGEHQAARKPVRVVDVCTGSGCVACALARQLGEKICVTGRDISAEALSLARQNAKALGAAVLFEQADLLEGLAAGSVDLVTANPPYVTTAECATLPQNVRDWEPRLALDGGADGLHLISRLVAEAANVLSWGGRLVMEIGEDQAPAVRELLCQKTLPIRMLEVRRDYAGRDRVVIAECNRR